MRKVLLASGIAGIVWAIIVVFIMSGRFGETLNLSFLLSGMVAGMAAGKFTVWSRIRSDGAESLWYGVATYYLGMLVNWGSYVIINRLILCYRHGGWTDFNLHDDLILIVWFVVMGTLVWGIVLIPLTFVTRYLIWRVYLRYVD